MQILEIPSDATDRLLDYLDAPVERMAFLIAEPGIARERWSVVDEMYLDDEHDYHYQGPHGMDLADEVRRRMLRWATRPDTALVEVHSHGAPSLVTTFSPTDLQGLADVVPQMLWRRRGNPYVALVLGDNDLDVLSWTRREAPPSVLTAVVLGDRTLTPTGRALNNLAVPEAIP